MDLRRVGAFGMVQDVERLSTYVLLVLWVVFFAVNSLKIGWLLGVMAMTSEYSSQSIITSLTVNPRRVMFMNTKALVLVLVTFLASFVGVLVAWGCAWLMVHGAFSSGAQSFSNNMAAVEMVGSTRPFQPTWGWVGAILMA